MGGVAETGARDVAQSCVDENRLLEFADGGLSGGERAQLRDHLLRCTECRQAFAATRDVEHAARPEQLGRYVILDCLGAGANGVVYLARDPELDRRVALKLSRADGWTPPLARRRFVREAQMLARVNHPNVVTVYDAGLLGDAIFIAMEYVAGESLQRWRQRATPTRAQIIEAFRQAARGLAAAHDAGIVHRDFKPANVLVGSDGRVRVADFGLARNAADDADAPAGEPPDIEERSTDLLSRSGMFIGTPAYMAPEQRRGEAAQASSDQYAFCVALAEALTGTRANPPDIAGCPGWLQPVLRRGLQQAPEARYPSMRALLAAMDAIPRRRRRIAVTATIAAIGVALGAALMWPRRDAGVCSGVDRYTQERWPLTRAAIVATFAGAGALMPLVEALDSYTEAWSRMRRETCEATRVHRSQSERIMDLRMRCLDRRLSELRQLTGVLLATTKARAVDHAVAAAHRLIGVQACADTRALTEAVPPPNDPALRETVTQLGSELDRALALAHIGDYTASLRTTRTVIARAEAAGYAPLRGVAYIALGLAHERLGQLAAAETAFRMAISAGSAARDDLVVAQAWVWLMEVVGADRSRYRELAPMADAARAATVRSGNQPREQARLLGVLAGTARAAGRYDEALAHSRRHLEIAETTTGSPFVLVEALHGLATSLSRLGRHAEAQRHAERALRLAVKQVGAQHPTVAPLLVVLGNSHYHRNEIAKAETHYRRALEIWNRAIGEETAMLGSIHAGIGDCRAAAGDFAAATRSLNRALAIWRKVYGPEHTQLAVAYNSLAVMKLRQHRHREGIALLRSALQLWRKHLDPHDPTIVGLLINLGLAHGNVADHRESERYCRQALAALQAKQRSSPSHLAPTLNCIGNAMERTGRGRRARTYLERALRLDPRHPLLRAEIEFGLARALMAPPADRGRAQRLAHRALAAFRAGGDQTADSALDVKTWLAKHGLATPTRRK